MRDVAALAGVSLKTVSRVINREAGVSAEVVARVDDAATQLDYRPDLNASNLRRSGGRTGTIGLLLEDVANEFSAAAHAGVEHVARKFGISVLASSTNEDRERERSLVRALSTRRVDGLIIAPSPGEQDYLEAEVAQGVPIVFIDRVGRGLEAPAVLSDNLAGAQRGVEQLLALGHRDIAFVGGTESLVTAQERYQGFLNAMASAGVTVDPRLVRMGVTTIEQSAAIIQRLLDSPHRPTAVFTAQNMITMGAVRALRACDLQHRIALIGFDDFTLADVLDPGVAVVAQDPRTIGQRAAGLLFTMMDDQSAARPRVDDVIVPTTLIMRPSGEIRPA